MVAYKIAPGLRLRSEYFGGLVWWPSGSVKKLKHLQMQVLYALDQPRDLSELSQRFGESLLVCYDSLLLHNLIVKVAKPPVSITDADLAYIKNQILIAKSRAIMRPFWVHLQPFIFCNQNCIHCYCDSGLTNKPFVGDSLLAWKLIVDKLVKFGVWDIYVTGGENLIVDECLELIHYIQSKGIGTAISTNGMVIKDKVLIKLKEINFPLVQVSLDGASAETNDFIRGKLGAFDRTIKGIQKLSKISKIAINCVVNRRNWREIESLVILGRQLGISHFKFFPQKLVGRSKKQDILSDQKILELQEKCCFLSKKYEVYVESIDIKKPCGSGISGFAINESFGIVPCVFSTHNTSQVFGNALSDDIEDIWFNSPYLQQFRKLNAQQPCHRCEPNLNNTTNH